MHNYAQFIFNTFINNKTSYMKYVYVNYVKYEMESIYEM